MPYRIQLTDEAFRPIAGIVEYNDLNGLVIGAEQIPEGGVFTLSDALLSIAFDMTFKSKGYYDFDLPITGLSDFSDITLQAKPSNTTEVIAGLSIIAIAILFSKKAV